MLQENLIRWIVKDSFGEQVHLDASSYELSTEGGLAFRAGGELIARFMNWSSFRQCPISASLRKKALNEPAK